MTGRRRPVGARTSATQPRRTVEEEAAAAAATAVDVDDAAARRTARDVGRRGVGAWAISAANRTPTVWRAD